MDLALPKTMDDFDIKAPAIISTPMKAQIRFFWIENKSFHFNSGYAMIPSHQSL
jgi:hypothetical protein